MKKSIISILVMVLMGLSSISANAHNVQLEKIKFDSGLLSDYFFCGSHPKFNYLLNNDGVMTINTMSASERWVENEVQSTILGFLSDFINQHNKIPYIPFSDQPIEDCDIYDDIDLSEQTNIFYGVGEFDWHEKSSPFKNLLQVEVVHTYHYGIYPFYINEYLIFDTKSHKRLKMQDIITLSPAAKKLIRNTYRQELKKSSMYGEEQGFINEQIQNLEIGYDDNMYFDRTGVIFWFTTSTHMLAEKFYVKIPYAKINPYLKPKFRHK